VTRPCLLAGLPWRTRVRLRAVRAVDTAAYWLVCRGRWRAAVRLYRLCGLWK
jgi:hypothetical protein